MRYSIGILAVLLLIAVAVVIVQVVPDEKDTDQFKQELHRKIDELVDARSKERAAEMLKPVLKEVAELEERIQRPYDPKDSESTPATRTTTGEGAAVSR